MFFTFFYGFPVIWKVFSDKNRRFLLDNSTIFANLNPKELSLYETSMFNILTPNEMINSEQQVSIKKQEK